ncbi:MAG: hypothetical protein ACQUHE_07340, partial [Bacteroidia bacterium]
PMQRQMQLQLQPQSLIPFLPYQPLVYNNSVFYQSYQNYCPPQLPQDFEVQVPVHQNQVRISNPDSYQQYQREHFMKKTVWQAHQEFLNTLQNQGTRGLYERCFKLLFNQKFLLKETTLLQFKTTNLEALLDDIRVNVQREETIRTKKKTPMCEGTKQNICSAIISFSGFLQRMTGQFVKIIPSKMVASKTFSFQCKEVKSSLLTPEDLSIFFKTLKEIDLQSFLFGCIQFNGARRISEVLNLRLSDIFEQSLSIDFLPLKKRATKKITVFYPKDIFELIKEYLAIRKRFNPKKEEYLFQDPYYIDINIKAFAITNAYRRAWKKISKQKNDNANASKEIGGETEAEAEIDKDKDQDNDKNQTDNTIWFPKGLSHSLRTTAITTWIRDFELWKVQLITGHSSIDSLSKYNKNGNTFNPSKNKSILPSFNEY